jgi:hypothetical protein
MRVERIWGRRRTSMRMRSSSSVQLSRLMEGSSWLCHRSRHCLPLRPGRFDAIAAHLSLSDTSHIKKGEQTYKPSYRNHYASYIFVLCTSHKYVHRHAYRRLFTRAKLCIYLQKGESTSHALLHSTHARACTDVCSQRRVEACGGAEHTGWGHRGRPIA